MSTLHPSQAPRFLSEPPLDAIIQSLPLVIAISLGVVAVLSFVAITHRSKVPLANPPRWYQIGLVKRFEFMKDGRKTIHDARKRYGKQPYRVLTDTGELLVLPPDYSITIRNENGLSFGTAIEKNFHAHVSGFEPFGSLQHRNKVVQTVVKKQLTKYLNTVTEPLSKEATFAIDVIFDKHQEWKEIVIADGIAQLIARLSTKVFLGDDMCRNEAWLNVSKEYTLASFMMAFKMTPLPSVLKPLVPWFSKEAKVVRQYLEDARAILTPMVTERNKIKAEARKKGEPVPEYHDMFEWLDNESQGAAYDPATYQMLLSFAAIHTTSELLAATMMRLANEPQSISALREEIVRVLSADGLTKSALANLKLMDSAFKETQRVKPASFFTMRRVAKQKVVLPDGFIIHKGQEVVVDGINMVDPEIYPDPEKYDIYRYYRMRQDPATANKAHLVSTGPDNLTFGHGTQSCPGRFFAANEMKIALCHLLLKYDWELGPGASLEPIHLFGEMTALNQENKLRYRRRKEEIDLETLSFT